MNPSATSVHHTVTLGVSGVHAMINGLQMLYCPLGPPANADLASQNAINEIFLPPNRSPGGALTPVACFTSVTKAQPALAVMQDHGKFEVSTVLFPARTKDSHSVPLAAAAASSSSSASAGGGGWPVIPLPLSVPHPLHVMASCPRLPAHRSTPFSGVSIVVDLLIHYAAARQDYAGGVASALPAHASSSQSTETRVKQFFIGEIRMHFDSAVHLFITDFSPTAVSRYVPAYPSAFTLRATVCTVTGLPNPALAVYGPSLLPPLTAMEPYHPDEGVLLDELEAMFADRSLFPKHTSTPHTNIHNRVKDLAVYERVIQKHCRGKWLHFIASHPEKLALSKDPTSKEIRIVTRADFGVHRLADQEVVKRRGQCEEQSKNYLQNMMRSGDVEYRELLDAMMKQECFYSLLTPSPVMFDRWLLSATAKELFWVKLDHEHTTRVGLAPAPGVADSDGPIPGS